MLDEKLLSYVEHDPFGGCWLWSGYMLYDRYPQMGVGGNRKDLTARVSWQLAYGPVPFGLVITQSCGVTACVNPDHLKAVGKHAAIGVRRNAIAQMKRAGLSERLSANAEVNSETGCHDWHGSKTHNGYASISVSGRTHRAHRLAYELAHGPIPDGLQIDHLCRNRGCINPARLEAVTAEENTRRANLAREVA